MRNLLWLALITTVACTQDATEQISKRGVYEEMGGDQILAFEGHLFYSGPRLVPNESRLLKDYGVPIQLRDTGKVRCMILAPIVLAISEESAFGCADVEFHLESQNANGTKQYLATRATPALQYRYTYNPQTGIERLEFVSTNPAVPGSILRHVSGPYLFGQGLRN